MITVPAASVASVFATDRVRLRPPAPDDAPNMFRLHGDPELHLITDDQPFLPRHVGQVRARLEKQVAEPTDGETRVSLLAETVADGTFLGGVLWGITAIESGMRWGELTEVRVRDLNFATRILTVSRADAGALDLPARTARTGPHPSPAALAIVDGNVTQPDCMYRCDDGSAVPGERLLAAANAICLDAATRGELLSQRMLARQLRGHGHRFPNEHLRQIANCAGLTTRRAA